MFKVYSFVCNPEKGSISDSINDGKLYIYPKKDIESKDVDIKDSNKIFFISIDDEKTMYKLKDKFDMQYLNGAIMMSYNDKVIMDLTQHDLIDQLWSYWINLLEELTVGGKVEVYFPDQPIKISLQDKVESLEVSIGEREFSFPKVFLLSILDGASHFFIKMNKYFEGYYSNEIKRIQFLIQNSLYLQEIIMSFGPVYLNELKNVRDMEEYNN
ncbi:hypothetical protein A9490_13690 [Bacillus thuringiensis]|uniref:hypothetical protein n=1 Tax=Bacillus thuringiensis TaxID=1428 RepID=UPI0008FE0A3B|nr:hypothetical protein [Bacillus thuringiensis]OJE17825.1 hypothetical protein A9490_13690 [Bacillus thuringiensis]